jgi:peroxiredoxin
MNPVLLAAEGKANFNVSSLEGIILKTATYQDYNLRRGLNRRNAIVFISSGAWDPYSNHILKTLRNVEADLTESGIQIIAIVPEQPHEIRTLQDMHDLPYVVASDPEHQISLLAGKILKLDEKTQKQIRDAYEARGKTLKVLPVNYPELQLLFIGSDGIAHHSWKMTSSEALITIEQITEWAQELVLHSAELKLKP